jgi:O-methyltransferase
MRHNGPVEMSEVARDERSVPFIQVNDLYLDLMKKALSFSLWSEPAAPITMIRYKRSFLKRLMVATLCKLAATRNWQIVENRGYTDAERQEGQLWPMQAHTMIGMKRLDNVQHCVEDVLQRGVAGDVIETGVWRGGACILMRAVLAAYGVTDRRVFVADSFEGLPKPDPRYPQDSGDRLWQKSFLAVSRQEVEENFRKYGLLDSRVVFLQGWFKDTLPSAPIERLAVMRLDGDLYGSTMDALTALYPKLSSGGYCIIDDYALVNAKRATDDYRRDHQIKAPIRQIDFTGAYWQKD